MCKFCDSEEYNPIASLKLDFGMFGHHELDISITEGDADEFNLNIDLSEDTDYEEGRNLLNKDIKINFCPMCGRKF